jgi:hypothetical protein
MPLAGSLAACGGPPGPGPGPAVPSAPTPSATTPPTAPPSATAGAATTKPATAFTGPMTKVEPSKLAADLQGLGLDTKNLPTLDKLDPKTLRKVMSTFTKSLGIQCGGCHSGDNFSAPTPMKNVARKMWNEWVRGYTLNGQPVYCDSCHQGREKFLDKRDKKALSAWMEANFVKQLDRKDKQPVECATCHGEDFDGDFLAKWSK